MWNDFHHQSHRIAFYTMIGCRLCIQKTIGKSEGNISTEKLLNKRIFDRILTGCYDHSINIWTTKGKHALTVPGHLAPVKAVSWISLNDKTGTFVSASQDQTAMVWEWNIEQNSTQCMFVCKGHERGVDSVDVSPSGKLFATGSWDTLLKVWSAGKFEKLYCGEVLNQLLLQNFRTPKTNLLVKRHEQLKHKRG